MDPIFQEKYPYYFDPTACDACSGRCCTGEAGNIWVNPDEIKSLADSLGMNQVDFIHQYLYLVGNRWSLVERIVEGQMACVFFDVIDRRCTVYAARPDQCRRFPFWDYYRHNADVLLGECPGISLIGNREDQV